MDIDFHNDGKRLKALRERIKKSREIHPHNKLLILDYEKYLTASRLRDSTIKRHLNAMKIWGELCEKQFENAVKEDITTMVYEYGKKGNTEYTMAMYRHTLKQFYKWLRDVDDFPKEVKWISSKPDLRKTNDVREGDHITPAEFKKLKKAAGLKWKAALECLNEHPLRPEDLFTRKIKDVNFKKEGVYIDFPPLKENRERINVFVNAEPALSMWIKEHPHGDSPDNWLWTINGSPPMYDTIKDQFKRLAKSAGIKRRLNLHLFRHTVAARQGHEGRPTENIEVAGGWVTGSVALRKKYLKPSSKNANEDYLRRKGVLKEKEECKRSIVECPRCKTKNESDSVRCYNCGVQWGKVNKKQLKIESLMREMLDNLRKKGEI